MNAQNNYVLYLAIGAVIILGGAYYLFFGTVTPTPVSEVATTTSTGSGQATGATTTPVSVAPTSGVQGTGTAVVTQGGNLKVQLPGTSFKVGASLSPITMTLPEGSEGKYLVLTLKPTATNTAKGGFLLGTPINSDGTNYPIQGLHLSTVTDVATNSEIAIVPGTYVIEAVLWDRNPLGLGGYKNVGGNNAYGTISAQLTVTP